MLVLVLILWAPGVYASLDTSFSACDGGECVGTSTSFDAELNNEIHGSNAADFSLGGVSMSHSILTSGFSEDLKDSYTSTGPLGSATAYYNVTNAKDISAAVNGNSGGIPNPYAWVELTAHNAERINAGAYASNTIGDRANVSIDILNGSVEGYYAGAGVGLDGGVFANQNFAFAMTDKGLIFTDSNSTNAAGDWTDAFTGVLNGTIFGYSSSANAFTDSTSVSQSATDIFGEEILSGAGGINRDEYKVSTGAHVVGGSIGGYSNGANAGAYSAEGSLYASSLEGEWALAREDASGQEGDRSKAYLSVLNGLIGNYGSNVYAESSRTDARLMVNEYDMFGNSMPTSGDRILASASSSNSAGDKASTSLIVEDGSIFNYYGIDTSALNNYVSASQNAGSISGKKICARANGTDSEGYNAISKMLAKNGTINNYAISTFVDSYYPWSRNVYAGQSLNNAYWDGVNGGLLSFGAFAFNDNMQANVSIGVLNGSINNYGYYYYGYSNSANANSDYDYIDASQYTGGVGGAEILASANSSNIDGDANTGMHVINGSVEDYNSYANGDDYHASANQYMSSMSGDFISFGGIASSESGYRAISGADVTGNKGYVGYANTYANEYKDDVNVNNYLDGAQGDQILAGWRAGKIGTPTLPEAMPVVEYEATGHVSVLDGSLYNYNSYASSGANFYTPYDVYGDGSAHGSSDFSAYAEEGAINFGSSSQNKEGDNAVVEATIVNGSAYGYSSGASANSKGADAYIGSSYGDGSMQGDRIDIISEASNGEGDQASGHTWAQNGQVYGYRSSASASLCTAQLQENLGNDPYNDYWGYISGEAAGTEWSASNLNGESLRGSVSVIANNPGWDYEPTLFYNLNKLTQAKKRTLEASQEMNAQGIISSSWDAVDKQGDSVNGEASVENGYAYFNNYQAVTPFSADATSEWGADGSLVSLDLSASDKRNDLAGVSAGATNGHLSGHANLAAKTDSAEASSEINGARNIEDGSVSSGWHAQNNKGDEASGSASVSGGTLAITNWAKATTSGAEGSEELRADADYISFDWNAKNKEGDEAYGWTDVYDGYVEASNSAKAVTTSATGSEDIELDAASMESHSWAENANGHFADTYAARIVDWLPCAATTEELETLDTTYLKYSSSAKATNTAATASQDVSDSVGSFLAGGEAGHVMPVSSLRTVEGDVYDQYAISEVNVFDGSGVTSTVKSQSNATGATATQSVATEDEFGSINLASIAGKGLMPQYYYYEDEWSWTGLEDFNITSEVEAAGGDSLTASASAKATTSGADTTSNINANGEYIGYDYAAMNKEGDEAFGWAEAQNGQMNARISAKASASSAEASENVEVNSEYLWSDAFAVNARLDGAHTWLYTNNWVGSFLAGEEELLLMNHVRYSSSTKATKTASKASQSVTDADGGFITSGWAGHYKSSSDLSNAIVDQVAAVETSASGVTNFASSSTFQSDAKGATAYQKISTKEKFDEIDQEGYSGTGRYMPSERRASNFAAYSGIWVDDGKSLTSTANAKALWSTGTNPVVTATASQDIVASGDYIEKWRGAVYSFDQTTGKFKGGAGSLVMIDTGSLTSIDLATAAKNSAKVESKKLQAKGDSIKRSFSAYSQIGEVWMWTNVTRSVTAQATLTDTSYTSSAVPTAVSLSGKWSAVGGTIRKNGYAKSFYIATPAKVSKKISSPATDIVDSASATKTARSAS